MLHGSGRQPSPVGATRVAKARSSAALCRPFAEGVASQPFAAYAAPTVECHAAHSREANKRRCHRRRCRPPAARSRAATRKGLFLRHSRGSGNPVRQYLPLGSRFRGNDGKGFLNSCFWMLHGSGRQLSPVGATRVAKARSSATFLRAIRRRGRFANLRGLRRSYRRGLTLRRQRHASLSEVRLLSPDAAPW
jgi:hypothetical protein